MPEVKMVGERVGGKLISRPQTQAEIDDDLANVPTAGDTRIYISSEIKRIARHYLDQVSQDYSSTEAIEWANDRAQYRANNIGHFQMRAGKYMTAQQYVDNKFKPRIEAGSYFSEQIKGIRTDLEWELANTTDADLATFDYKSRWDDIGDFVAPDTDDVPTTWWQSLISILKFWGN